jgi:alpha-L-fucosidase
MRISCVAFLLCLGVLSVAAADGQQLPKPEPIPAPKPARADNSLTMQDPATFPEVKMDFPMATGPFEPTWESINQNYPAGESWLREAKFGIWVHFGPQAAGESGDWYARKLYQPGTEAYANHLRSFGHPSVSGYMDVLRNWNPNKLDPQDLARLYKEAGAGFVLVQGVHHDNFDNWNSRYQPWNSVNMGPHRDLLGEWGTAARKEGLKFGVAFHHEYTWWWWQPAFGSDTEGEKAGVPYDAARLSLADGKGKWWLGYDPRLLYGVNLRAYQHVADVMYNPEKGIFQEDLEYAHWYANRWSLRILDVIEKYDPDFIYTDGDSTQPFSGEKTGTGYKCDCVERVLASYYNRALALHGKVDTVGIIKFHTGTRGVINTVESQYPKEIKRDQPWIGENALGDWFYHPGFTYSSRALILYMLEVVSRDGTYAVNIPMRPDGSIDEGARTTLREVGAWMRINGQGIYGSHAWKIFGEGEKDTDGQIHTVAAGALGEKQASEQFTSHDFRFTQGKDGAVYAFLLGKPQPGEKLLIRSLGSAAGLLKAQPKSVTLLGSTTPVKWMQSGKGIEIVTPAELPAQPILAFRVM